MSDTTKIVFGTLGTFAILITLFVLLAGAVRSIAQSEVQLEVRPLNVKVDGIKQDVDTIKSEFRSFMKGE